MVFKVLYQVICGKYGVGRIYLPFGSHLLLFCCYRFSICFFSVSSISFILLLLSIIAFSVSFMTWSVMSIHVVLGLCLSGVPLCFLVPVWSLFLVVLIFIFLFLLVSFIGFWIFGAGFFLCWFVVGCLLLLNYLPAASCCSCAIFVHFHFRCRSLLMVGSLWLLFLLLYRYCFFGCTPLAHRFHH